jgi:hypothetical protein
MTRASVLILTMVLTGHGNFRVKNMTTVAN